MLSEELLLGILVALSLDGLHRESYRLLDDYRLLDHLHRHWHGVVLDHLGAWDGHRWHV